jgi:polygalacturonase
MSNTRIILSFLFAASLQLRGAMFDVKTFGAKADGKSSDREPINKAIDAAAAAGGGTVYFPAGTYVTGSIRLKSNITLQFEHGTVLEASADPVAYDKAEPNEWDKFQVSRAERDAAARRPPRVGGRP